MTKQKNLHQKLPLSDQLDELTAIYEDYLNVVRQHERTVQSSPDGLLSVDLLAQFQMYKLYNESLPEFPWNWDFMNFSEKQEFQDIIVDNRDADIRHSYISLQHINPDDNNAEPIQLVPDGYMAYSIDMQLPSMVERYIIVYPENATVGSTTFFIDSLYKATYNKEKYADMPVGDFFNRPKAQTEFRILINLINACRKMTNPDEKKYHRQLIKLYAEETTSPWENTVLEVLGLFAEKVRDISRKLYNPPKNTDDSDYIDQAFKYAEKNGMIPSAADFQDYLNIRHLMRHQWDTKDGLGNFYLEKADINIGKRAEYVQSYLRLCDDKTIIQRSKAYIEILHQMQHIIGQLKPEYIIRDNSESKTKFAERLKQYHRKNPDKVPEVELNCALSSDIDQALRKNLHKIFPNIKIKEEQIDQPEEFAVWEEDYNRRSWFLQTYHSLECKMMTYCFLRGEDLNNKKTWDYFYNHNLIAPEEQPIWQKYTDLRNNLSHNFYDSTLRQTLRDIADPFIKSVNKLEIKINNLTPISQKTGHYVYTMTHQDGLRVTIDYKNRKIVHSVKRPTELQLKQQGKIELPQEKHKDRIKVNTETPTETYGNGVEYTVSNGKIISFKMPSGITLNFEKQRLIWPNNIQFHTNAEHFNVLQSENYKLLTDKNLRVTEFWEKRRRQPVRGGDTLLLEYRHRAYIDTIGRLKDFSFKTTDGQIIKTAFKQTKNGTKISFNDGTVITLHGQSTEVSYNGKILNYDSRQEFAAAYTDKQPLLSQITKHGNGR